MGLSKSVPTSHCTVSLPNFEAKVQILISVENVDFSLNTTVREYQQIHKQSFWYQQIRLQRLVNIWRENTFAKSF